MFGKTSFLLHENLSKEHLQWRQPRQEIGS